MEETKTKKNEIVIGAGCDLLNLVVGGGKIKGFPSGKIINIVGDKSSGKTFLACEIIANAYYKYGKKLTWFYDDTESGFTFDTKSLYGIEIMNNIKALKSGSVEELYSAFRLFAEGVKSDQIGIYVVDSLDGLRSKEIEDRGDQRFKAQKAGKEFNQGSYQMGKPKFLSQEFFPHASDICEKKNITLIIISQTRDKIGSMFKQKTRAGGNALDFYAHSALWLSVWAKIKKKDRVVEVVIKALAKKNKTARPFRQCVFSLLFDYGIDNTGSNIDYLFNLRGDSGELLKVSKSIIYDEKALPMKAANIKEFLVGEKTEVVPTTKDGMLSYIEKNELLKKKFEKVFGTPMDRSQLIETIEDKNSVKELSRRVEEKWEAIEEEIRTKRKPKF